MTNSRATPLAALLALGLAVTVQGAAADDFPCPPNLGAVTIDGNVVVNGRACVLDKTRVKGNVLVYPGGSLTVRDAAIDGNIQAEGAKFVRVVRTEVGGDIQLDDLLGNSSNIARSTVGGSIQLNGNRVPLVVQYNSVDSDVQAFSNTGGLTIRYNTIDGNLQCQSNVPAPTGGFNQVSGNKEDQCRRL